MATPQAPRQTIPFGRHSSHFVHIHNSLVEVLTQIKAKGLNCEILWVSCRLNRSGTNDLPVFAGWVEDIGVIRTRVQKGYVNSPIDIRFNDSNKSNLYTECLKLSAKKFYPRNWAKGDLASPGSQEIGKKFYDETHRRSTPVKINDRSVGTLNAAFRCKNDLTPDEETKIGEVMFPWGQDPTYPLVKYIEQNLDYSPK